MKGTHLPLCCRAGGWNKKRGVEGLSNGMTVENHSTVTLSHSHGDARQATSDVSSLVFSVLQHFKKITHFVFLCLSGFLLSTFPFPNPNCQVITHGIQKQGRNIYWMQTQRKLHSKAAIEGVQTKTDKHSAS